MISFSFTLNTYTVLFSSLNSFRNTRDTYPYTSKRHGRVPHRSDFFFTPNPFTLKVTFTSNSIYYYVVRSETFDLKKKSLINHKEHMDEKLRSGVNPIGETLSLI